MKWCLVIVSYFVCCGAQDYQLNVVQLPTQGSETRIIGGIDSTIERYPYVVQVLYNNRLACGGSLVTRRHVLTAAHCFFDQNNNPVSPARYSIRGGTRTLEQGGFTRQVSTVIIHERYNLPVRDNDVAVMLLTSTVTLGQRVAVATIPAQGQELADNLPVVHVGWGRTNANVNQAASILQEVTVRTVNLQTCAARYQYLSSITGEPYPVTSNMICSGLLDIGGADACQGDSGGPLVYSGVVVGVTSWGYGCAEPLFPGVNAKVAAYTNWINATVTRYNSGPQSTASSVTLLALSAIFCLVSANR